MDPATSFLWQGRLCSDTDLGIKIRELPVSIIRGLALRADPDRIFDAADSIGGRLLKGDCLQLIEDLQQVGLSGTDTRASLLEVGQILLRSCLERKYGVNLVKIGPSGYAGSTMRQMSLKAGCPWARFCTSHRETLRHRAV